MNIKRILIALSLLGAFAAVSMIGTHTKKQADAQLIRCAAPVQGCVFQHRDNVVQLRFSRIPSPMRPFTMSLHAPGAKLVRAEFQMVGMDMGFNRYDLRKVSPNLFNAQITLPVCVSGRRDWKLHLQIDSLRYMIPFTSA